MVSTEYKNFACVKNLGEYAESFDKIVKHYGEDLNKNIVIDGSIYTLHDFDCHCTNIYKIVSQVLLDTRRTYTQGLTTKEIYILDLAVLFHDISMSRDILTVRGNHSKKSADYVQTLYDDKESYFYKECNLTNNEIKALKHIIMAHSDVKDENIPLENRGLKDPKLTNSIPARSGFIRGKLLAGILRLADELDVTSERLGNTNIEANLKKAKEKHREIEIELKSGKEDEDDLQYEYQKYTKYIESLKHWEKLHLFEQIYREEQDDTIYLVTDNEYLQQLLDEGHTAIALARKILNIYEKIVGEWKNIKYLLIETAPNKLDIKSFFPISEIKVKCDVNSICQELDKQLENIMTVKAVDRDEEFLVLDTYNKNKKGVHEEKKEIQLIDENLSQKLTKEVNCRHLLKVGHFLLDDIYCARDWIDIKELIETKKIAEEIVEILVNYIKNNEDLSKRNLVVGLDLEGALVASRVAMGIKVPFSYIIPVKDHMNSSSKEFEISINNFDNVILITDAIVTFDTIQKALENIEKENCMTDKQILNKVSSIYSIFYRKCNLKENTNVKELKGKTYCLNMDFPAELFKKEECPYIKKGQCLALNNQRK